MRRRLFTLAAGLSAAVCAITATATVLVGAADGSAFVGWATPGSMTGMALSQGDVWFFRAVAVAPARFSGQTGLRQWADGEIDWYQYRLRDPQMAWNWAGVSLPAPGRAEVHDLILPCWFIFLSALILPGLWLVRRYRRRATPTRNPEGDADGEW